MPTNMTQTINHMKNRKFAPASRTSFSVFFSHLQTILALAFERRAVVAGWSDAGIYDPSLGGYNAAQILGGWNPGGQNPKSCWRMLTDDAREYILAAIPILAKIGMEKGEISDEEVDSCSVTIPGKPTLTIRQIMCNEAGCDSLIPEHMKLQIPAAEIDVGRGINLRRCILMTNATWLEAAKRSRALRGAGAVKFDPASCKCGSKTLDFTGHQNIKMHKRHVEKLVAALVQAGANGAELKFANGVLVDLDDSALLLARAQYATIASAAAPAPAPAPMIAIDQADEAFSEDEGTGGDAEDREEGMHQQGEQSSGQELAELESDMMNGMPDESEE